MTLCRHAVAVGVSTPAAVGAELCDSGLAGRVSSLEYHDYPEAPFLGPVLQLDPIGVHFEKLRRFPVT